MDLSRFPRRRYTEGWTPLEFLPHFTKALRASCPDGAGPKYAFTRDRNGDGLADLCFQSGYQEKGTPGDLEFHARLNNTTTVGTQAVVWCYDPDRDDKPYVKDYFIPPFVIPNLRYASIDR